MTLPSHSPITPGYGFGSTLPPYSVSNPHKGTDFQHVPDNTIYAPISGRVTLVPNNGNDGNGIYLTDTNGDFHGLLHSSQYLVQNGSVVTEGQRLAIMGDTGAAQGVHLHWCVKRNGVFIDPMKLIKEDEVSSTDIANVRGDRLKQIATLLNLPDGDDQSAIVQGIQNVQQIAQLRADRLSQIAKLLGVDSGDDQGAIVAAIDSQSTLNKTTVLKYVQDNLK